METSINLLSLGTNPEVSVVVPVFNQELTIKAFLAKLLECLSLRTELILVNDASEDDSLSEILHFIENLEFPQGLTNIKLIDNKKSKFETRCDNQGFKAAAAPFVLEIQADMFFFEKNFDSKMREALYKFPRVAAVSGRGVTTFDTIATELRESKSNPMHKFLQKLAHSELLKVYGGLISMMPKIPRDESGTETEVIEDVHHNFGVGRLGMAITEIPTQSSLTKRELVIGPYIMRGPIMFRQMALEDVGLLDENSFYLGFDDADWCIRAKRMGWECGYLPVGYEAPLKFGSTRKIRSVRQLINLYKCEKETRKHVRDSGLWNILPQEITKNFRFEGF